MRIAKCMVRLAVTVLTLLTTHACAAAAGTTIHFLSLDRDHPFALSGTLLLPKGTSTPSPAVVIVHGTAGIDSRGAYYQGAILDAGIAIFEVDFKTGIYTGPIDRPSPDALVAMGFAALKELRKLPAIDPDRIGIMGFSMGGHLAVNAAFEGSRSTWLGSEKGFAAHVAFYPVCKPFLRQSDVRMTGAPMIILYGTEDSYGDDKAVPALKDLLKRTAHFDLTTVEYAGATHGFNRSGPPLSYRDPAAIGGKAYMAWSPEAANDSLAKVLAFLRSSLTNK
jgi:dienelactone hydrolase